MRKEMRSRTAGRSAGLVLGLGRTLLIGVAGTLAAAAWLSLARDERQEGSRQRRYADRGEERRNPMHFFLAGVYPRRREIDRSGRRPLFERRQSVYDSY